MSIFTESPFFGLVLTLVVYVLAAIAHSRIKSPLVSTFLLSLAAIITVLYVFKIPYESYYVGGSVINIFLGPSTICLGISIFDKLALLKKNLIPVLAGCFAGVVVSVGSILIMCRLFGLDHSMTAAFLPKSVTTPIATALSESYGGIVSVTVAAVIVTGLVGSIGAPFFIKIFRISDPLAVGLGIGACSHALGTARAMEFGKTEGAAGALAIGLCGIMTSVVILVLNIFI